MNEYSLTLTLPATPGIAGRDYLGPLPFRAADVRDAIAQADQTIREVASRRTVTEARLEGADGGVVGVWRSGRGWEN